MVVECWCGVVGCVRGVRFGNAGVWDVVVGSCGGTGSDVLFLVVSGVLGWEDRVFWDVTKGS